MDAGSPGPWPGSVRCSQGQPARTMATTRPPVSSSCDLKKKLIPILIKSFSTGDMLKAIRIVFHNKIMYVLVLFMTIKMTQIDQICIL